MRTGEVEANLVRLNETAELAVYSRPDCSKVGGPEKGRLEKADLEFHEDEYQRLTALVEQECEAELLAGIRCWYGGD